MHLLKKKKERDTQDLFVTEGIKMAREAPRERVVSVYVSESFAAEHGKEPWLARYKDESSASILSSVPKKRGTDGHTPPSCARYEVVSDAVMRAMSDTQTPQGVICLIRQYHYSEEMLGMPPQGMTDVSGVLRQTEKPGAKPGQAANSQNAQPLLLALENLQDPGNLGTILRTAEGAGVSGILMSEGCVDIYNPKVIRSTMGAVYRVPFCYARDFNAALLAWRKRGIRVYATHLKGSVCYDHCDYTGPSAFLIGNESKGLSEACAACADQNIKIPMAGQVESLNAAVAAAIVMYEAARQRR